MRRVAALLLLALPLAAQTAREYGKTHRLKIDVGGEERKVALFIPDNVKKGEVLPLLVALPGGQTQASPEDKAKAFLEIGQWQQPAFDRRFCVFSVDLSTSTPRGWHPKDQLEMQRDMEAVIEGLKVAREEAAKTGVTLDDSATVVTGWSGATYLTLWMGIRRPDVFMAACGRGCVFHKEAVEFTEFDKIAPDKAMPILLYYGEVDNPRVKKDTDLAKKTLEGAGFTKVSLQVVPAMAHESKPEVFLEWYGKILKETERPRKESAKIREELAKLRPDVAAAKPGAYGKLLKLVEQEKKVGAKAGAAELLAGIVAEAKKAWDAAENIEADHQLRDAADAFGKIEKQYMPLDIAKEARDKRLKILQGDAFKAMEYLERAKELIEKGARDKAIPILEKIVSQYGSTPSADEARLLLTG
ncbi:MAG: alpha/beta hydrolase family protein [Planctomycetota bacterium]